MCSVPLCARSLWSIKARGLSFSAALPTFPAPTHASPHNTLQTQTHFSVQAFLLACPRSTPSCHCRIIQPVALSNRPSKKKRSHRNHCIHSQEARTSTHSIYSMAGDAPGPDGGPLHRRGRRRRGSGEHDITTPRHRPTSWQGTAPLLLLLSLLLCCVPVSAEGEGLAADLPDSTLAKVLLWILVVFLVCLSGMCLVGVLVLKLCTRHVPT